MVKVHTRKNDNLLYTTGAILFMIAQGGEWIVSNAVGGVKKMAKKAERRRVAMGRFEKARVSRKRMVSWYWDVRLWTPLYVLIIALLVIGMKHNNDNVIIAEAIDAGDTEIAYEVENTVAETISVEEANERAKQEMAIGLARLADSVAGHRDDSVKRAVMWVAINRSEDGANGYGRPLLEEIERPRQWQNYDPEAIYLESTLEIANEVIDVWFSGGARPMAKDMLWFVLNGDGSITVRNRFGNEKNRAEATFGQ